MNGTGPMIQKILEQDIQKHGPPKNGPVIQPSQEMLQLQVIDFDSSLLASTPTAGKGGAHPVVRRKSNWDDILFATEAIGTGSLSIAVEEQQDIQLHNSFEREYAPYIKASSAKFVNFRDFQGKTALHVAALKGNFEAVKTLLLNKASLFSRDEKKQRPIDIAIDPLIKQFLRCEMISFSNEHRKLIAYPSAIYDPPKPALHGKEATPKPNLNFAHMITLSTKKLTQFIHGYCLDSYLSYAMKTNNKEAIEYMLHRQASPLTSNDNMENFLHFVVNWDHVPVLRYLCEGVWTGFSSEAVNMSSETSEMLPEVRFPEPKEILKRAPWAREAWAALDQTTKKEGYLPFHLAAIRGNPKVLLYIAKVCLLRERDAGYRESAGKRVMSLKDMINYPATQLLAPVHLAIQTNRTEAFDALHSILHCSIYIQSSRMQNPLHLAVISQNETIIRQLVLADSERCFLKHQRDWRGFFPRDYDKKNELYPYLISVWEAVSCRNLGDIYTVAIKSKDLKVLCKHHSETGNTPLHMAVLKEDARMARLLIEIDADKSLVNNEGKTPLDLIEQMKSKEEKGKMREAFELPPSQKIVAPEVQKTISLFKSRKKSFLRTSNLIPGINSVSVCQ